MIPKSLKRGEESTSTPPPGCLVEIFGSCRHEWDRGFESGLLQRRVVRTPVPTSKRPAFKGEDKSPTPFIMPERVRRPVTSRRAGTLHRPILCRWSGTMPRPKNAASTYCGGAWCRIGPRTSRSALRTRVGAAITRSLKVYKSTRFADSLSKRPRS